MLSSSDFLKGTLTTLILSLLTEHGKMYGYEICQKTKALSRDEINLTEGAIYPALHKLEKKGLIISSKDTVNGRIRKYYSINQVQHQSVTSQIESLKGFIKALGLVIKTN